MNQRLIRSGFIPALVMPGALHTAQARVNVHLGIGIPGMVFAPPPPVIVARPVHYWPPPVMYSRFGYPVWVGGPRPMGPRHVHPAWRHRRWH